MKRAVILPIVSLFLLSFPIRSQEWGNISQEMLQMTAIPEAPEADAVILFDIGELSITREFSFFLKRHVRIKILTQQGKKYADVRLRYFRRDKIDDLEAQCFLPNGKKIKLDDDQIFNEKGDNWNYKIFAIPGVEVGSVIEYKYEKFSKNLLFLEPWTFQNKEFTSLSQFSVSLLPYFKYDAFFTNIIGLDPEPDVEDMIVPIGSGRFTTRKNYTWRMENIDPLKEEPYMPSIEDYFITLYFQLSVVNSWDELAKGFGGSFEKYYNDNGLKNHLYDMDIDSLSPNDKAKTIYNNIIETIETSDHRTGSSDSDFDDIFEEKRGTSFQKNMLLTSLLRLAGLEAYPVFIRPKERGSFNEHYPNLQQLEHIIVCLNIDDQQYFLDTKEKYCPFGMLPPSYIVDKGFLVDGETGRIIEIPEPRDLNWLNVRTEAAFQGDGVLSCSSILRYEGYRAMELREKLTEIDKKEYFEGMLKERFGEIKLDSLKIMELENIEAPVYVDIKFELPSYVDLKGEMMYFSYPTINRLDANPFKKENRKFPIEYNYPLSSLEEIELTLPDGFIVIEKPKTSITRTKGITFACAVENRENSIRIKRQYMRTVNHYSPTEYESLRNFFSRVVSADNGIIVLSKEK